jgi:hypothetical protein
MGRNKINPETKKKSISIVLDKEVYQTLEELNIENKSKLINWVLKEHFSLTGKGGVE